MLRPAYPLFFLLMSLSGCAHFKQQDPQQQQVLQQQQQALQQQQQLLLQQQQELQQNILQQEQQYKQLEQTALLLTQVENLQTSLNNQDINLEGLDAKLLTVDKSLAAVNQKVRKIAKNSKIIKQDSIKQNNCIQGNKYILGEEEWVYLPVINKHVKARIDSGATTSSISATNIERFERDGQKWVRFDLYNTENDTNTTLERPLDRRVAIKQSSADKKESRLVISLMLKMGDLAHHTEFSLADRSQMEYPILLGRSFLRDIALIDVSQQFIQKKFEPQILSTLAPTAPGDTTETTDAIDETEAADTTDELDTLDAPSAKKATATTVK